MNLNPFKSFKNFHKKVKAFPDEQVIAIALENNGKITGQILSYKSDLTLSQARWKLSGMNTRGIFKQAYDYTDYTTVYKLKNKELYQNLSHTRVNPIKKTEPKEEILDSEVITLAVKMGGKVTPAALCVKKEISLKEAKEKLDDLLKKDVFDIELNEKGAIVYVLNDFESFKEILDE